MSALITRRQFLKRSGAAAAGLGLAGTLGFDLSNVRAAVPTLRTLGVKPVPTVCPFCGSGCGLVVFSEQDENGQFKRLLSVQGDPDNPVNRGGACAKGASMFNLREIYDPETGEQMINPKRIGKPMFRKAYTDKWVEKEWDEMLDEIAQRVKESRDNNFIHEEALADGSKVTVNRCESIACVGGSALDNEEAYLQSKMIRALGVVFVETQARLCHSSTVAGLAPSFGRGVMTNHVIDMKNADVALILGSNAAENHPITFKWLTRGREERGTKIIHVDPRFNRTSRVSDLYAPMRPGTDIALLGGMIKYILDNERYHLDYVVSYTNASFLVKEEFAFNDGLFSGYDPEQRKYDTATWDYQLDDEGNPLKDPTLSHPRSVFQLMKQHYERYDIDTVCSIVGMPKNKYLQVLELFTSTYAPDKTGVILYAMGITQHTVGSQNIRAYAIIQLLLGNIGRAGGGIAALRGENNVQGGTDMALLNHILPGYLGSPVASAHPTYEKYLEKETPKTGYWKNKPKFLASLLKAWWPNTDLAQAYDYVPKRRADKNYTFISMVEDMYKGSIEGLFVFGSNPVVGGPNGNKLQRAFSNLKWMVQTDHWLNETSEFWTYQGWERPSERVDYERMTPENIGTDVYFLPACVVYEKEGTATSTGRWMQYRWKGAEPVGESMADLWIIDQIAQRIKKLYVGSTRSEDLPITELNWDYGHGHEPELFKVGLELNGYYLSDGKPVEGFAKLADDGSTACGCWVYSNCMGLTDNGQLEYKSQRRDNNDPSKEKLGLYPNWSWAWPMNRRIAYNRCSVQPDGVTPWAGDEKRTLIYWDPSVSNADGTQGKWVGDDVPDFNLTLAPNAPGGTDAFIMRAEGKGCIFAAKTSMTDGPFPEHYEPWESPAEPVLNSQPFNPAVIVWEPEQHGDVDEYPLVATTFRLVEHWQTGSLTRNTPWLSELMPNMFIELSEELARQKGIKNGHRVLVSSKRGEIEAVACVTKRLKPMKVGNKYVHVVGMPWQFGFKGYATGDPANRLTPSVGCANTTIPEYKAFLCDVRRA